MPHAARVRFRHGRREGDSQPPNPQGVQARARAAGQLDELFELARWAPNHHLTNPWRFRVVGPRALERSSEAAGPEAAPKLDRAPTLVVCSCVLSGDPVQDEEDLHATACAAYIVLLGAHARGLAGYWRTPAVLRTDAGRTRSAWGTGSGSSSLIHLGEGIQERPAPARAPVAETVTYLE